MSRARIIFTVWAMAILIGAGITIASGTALAQSSPLSVTLNPLNDSGQSGTAVLTDMGNGTTKVDITITGEPAGASEPVHIHNGQCGANLGSVKYPLTNVVNGASTTTISATLASLQTGNFAVNGHKSTTEMTVYVFCGNIPAAAAPAAAATATVTATATTTTTAPSTLPTTGGDPYGWLLPLFLIGIVVLAAGVLTRALSR